MAARISRKASSLCTSSILRNEDLAGYIQPQDGGSLANLCCQVLVVSGVAPHLYLSAGHEAEFLKMTQKGRVFSDNAHDHCLLGRTQTGERPRVVVGKLKL